MITWLIIIKNYDLGAHIFHYVENFDARVTLYASSTDRALKYSKKINGYKRVGDTGEDIIIEEGIDTVDATNVDTSFMGHSYYGDNRSVMSDMNEVIKENRDPSNRFELENISTEKGIYWQFRK